MSRLWVGVGGGQLAAWDVGAGDDAIVLHGGPGLTDYTGGLAAELNMFRTVRYQQRGLPPSVLHGDKSVGGHVADLLAVLDALRLDRSFIIGHSWGGVLALHFAVAHPDRVRGLIIVDGSGGVGSASWDERHAGLDRRLSGSALQRLEEFEQVAQRRPLTDAEDAEAFELLWPAYFAHPETAPPPPPIRSDRPGYMEAVASIDWHFANGTLDCLLPKLDAPCLFLHGELDPLPVAAIRATAAVLPNAKLEVIPDCGHFPWLEKPGTIGAAVNAWLRDMERVPT